MNYLIFIDSNPIIAANYSILSSYLKEFVTHSNQIVISKVTVDEVIRKYNFNQSNLLNELMKTKRKCENYGIQFEISEEIQKIDARFISELNELSVDILDISTADINFIYEKAMGLKKPFKKNKDGKETGGIKDVLIWNSWLMYAIKHHMSYDQIIILTKDSDYINIDDEVLEQDLINDLEHFSLPTEKFKVVFDIKKLLEMVVVPFLNTEIADVYIDASIGSEADTGAETEYFIDKAEEVILLHEKEIEASLEEAISEIIGEDKEPRINFLSKINNMNFKEKEFLNPDGSISIYFTEEFEVSFLYFLPKSDYNEMIDKNIEIEDYDWNDYVYLVSEIWYTEIGFEATLSIEDDQNIIIENSEYFLSSEFTPAIMGSIYEDETETRMTAF